MKILKKYWWLLLVILISLVFFRVQDFIKPIQTFSDNFKNGQIFFRYSSNNDLVFQAFKDKLLTYALAVYHFFDGFNLILFLTNVLNFFLRFMIYFVNYGINGIIYIYLFIYIFVSKEVPDLKMTRGSQAVIKMFTFFSFLKKKVIDLFRFIKRIKSKIFTSILIFFFFKGILLSILIELAIFIYYYIFSAFSMQIHILLLSIFKSIVIWITINIPLWLQIIIGFFVLYYLSYNQAEKKLQKNLDSLKVIIKYDVPYITIFNGKPGAGKTRSLVAFAEATVEVFIEELEEIL